MGGGSSSFWRGADPESYAKRMRDEEAKALDEAFETDVNAYLADQLVQFNDRDVDAVAKILESVRADLAGDTEGTIDLLFGGSVAKHTYVDGLSDVDALVLFDRADLANNSPSELRDLLAEVMRSRYGRDRVTEGNLAVTAEIRGQTIQLLPALRSRDGYRISSYDGTRWTVIYPQRFTDNLTAANRANAGKVIPTIKLAKAIIATLPEKQRLTGYHTEALAIEAFGDYAGPQTPKAMLGHFFARAALSVQQPIDDPTGQSPHVDDYLGDRGSVERRSCSMAMDRIARRIRNADAMRSLHEWRLLLGDN